MTKYIFLIRPTKQVDFPVFKSQVFDKLVPQLLEHCLKRRDVTNPMRYFGGSLKMIPNIIKVGLHANKFLDLSAVENYLLTEYHIRS